MSIPPKMQGCVICHNLPASGNFDPYCWPLKEHSEEWSKQAEIDIDKLISQRDELRRELEELHSRLKTVLLAAKIAKLRSQPGD
jgi:hypothetical protein